MARETESLEHDDKWMHRSSRMTCATCMWWVQKVASTPGPAPESGNVIGRCRRHAPTMNGYPVAFSGDWCGDHKLDENQ